VARLATALLVAMFLGLAPPVMSQVPEMGHEREQAFETAKRLIRERPEILKVSHSLLGQLLGEMGEESEEPASDSMRIFLEEIADEPANNPYIRQTALWSLGLFGAEQEHERMQRCLNDPDLKIAAATMLVRWGYWDEGSPLLIENESFGLLVLYARSKAEPVVREAMVSASPLGRVDAASCLAEYGDSLTKVNVARELIQQYVILHAAYADTTNLSRALYLCYEIIRVKNDPEDLMFLEAGIRYQDTLVRSTTFGAIFDRAREGDSQAISILQTAARTSSYSDIKEAAKYKLQEIGQQK
jgi:hypothetical protein